MNELEWCKEQRKGIKLVEPGENLSDAYLKKAEEALEIMNSISNADWIISTGYYSMYYSLYAVLMRAGVKSGMHSCTIECMRSCLQKFFSFDEVEMLENSRKMRVQSQYSAEAETAGEQAAGIVANAPRFLLKCRFVCNRMTADDIADIRRKISLNNTGRN